MLYLFVVEYCIPANPQTSHLRRLVYTRCGGQTEIAVAGLETKRKPPMSYKTIRRDWLMKQIDKGVVRAKCDMHLTDDYACDNASGFGKTGWMAARISRPTWTTITLENGIERDIVADHDFVDGQMNLNEHDFTGKSGSAYRNDDGTITLRVHSNLVYLLRLVPELEDQGDSHG